MSQSIYGRRGQGDFFYDSPDSSSTPSGDLLDAKVPNQKGVRSPSPGRKQFEMAAPASTSGKLAQEIHDEFLVCKICLEGYKNPKSLNCLHTFCECCIESHVMSESTYKKYSDYREFTCPLCRKRTQLPIGGVKKLPDNFLVSSLSEIVQRQRPSKFPFCDICKLVSRKHKEAKSKCLDCAKLLCESCVDMHKETKVTQNHSLFDVEIEKDIECHEHQDEVVRFYCEPCETCICVLCTFNEHKDHEITQFGEAVTKYKEHITNLLGNCQTKIDKFDVQLQSLNQVEEIIKDTEERIHDTAIKFIAEIRNREKQMLEELQNLYGKDLMDMVENKKDLSIKVDNLRTTCNLTEVVLKGKDIELLLLKKDVQEKLSSMNSIDIKCIPTTITKQVNFVIGEMDLGYIQDMDRPVLTKMRIKKSGTGNQGKEEQVEVAFSEKQTQTEKKVPDTSEEETSSEEEDETTEEESESEEEEEKPDVVERGVQTDPLPQLQNNYKKPQVETKEQSVITDVIITEDKGINTRSRSLQTLSTSTPKPPPKSEGSTTTEDSLAARRRRRRERVQVAQSGGGQYNSIDIPDSQIPRDHELTYMERRKRNLGHHQSMDTDDVFYDADAHTSAY
eukprot:GHVU01217699.1.p1 GENE.GHVU01217699.1~~GHVU01217699.1.p1  ORF type:complete len:618 (+),score=96.50 GHVU01217699.1:146-1999(+)